MYKSINLSFLYSFTSQDGEKLKKYITMFLNMCQTQLPAMSQNLSFKNYNGVFESAHILKSSVSLMGMDQAEPVIQKIATIADSKIDLEELPALIEKFNSICSEAIIELNTEIKNLSKSD